MPQFTPEQHDAVFTLDKNLIVAAGAGSGKTHVLVERFLNILQQNPDWDISQVVAITFTRAAALEMRNRVRKELEKRLRSGAEPQALWAKHLARMDGARLDTIHGLCASILRTNAAIAEIDPSFAVLQPAETRVLLQDVINRVLRDAQSDRRLRLFFATYKEMQIREIFLQEHLLIASRTLMETNHDAIFRHIRASREQFILDFYQQLRQSATFMEIVDASMVDDVPDNDKIKLVAINIVQTVTGCENVPAELIADTLLQLSTTIALRGSSAKIWGEDEFRIVKAQITAFRDHLKDYSDCLKFDHKANHRSARLMANWYHLLQWIDAEFTQAKRSAGGLDFSDLELLTANILQHRQVQERYRNAEFKVLLVDEFQDTNRQQWAIVQALVDTNSPSLFVVGDQKQSIYGFRGADVAVFTTVAQEIGRSLANGKRLALSQSFRSHQPLVDSLNGLFERILQKDNFQPANYQIAFDEPMHSTRQQPQSTAYQPIEMLLLHDETLNAEDYRPWEAYEIAQHLKRLKNQKALIHDKALNEERPFDYGDVALLFRSTTNLTTYEKVLKHEGVPFVTIAGRGYYDRSEVWDLRNLLQALYNPRDELALASVLRSPLFAFDDELLLALRWLKDETGKRLSLWHALQMPDVPYLNDEHHTQLQFAYQVLTELNQLSGRVTIAQLLRMALARTGYLAVLEGLPNGIRLRENVDKFIRIAEASGKVTLGAFTAYIEGLTAQEVREGEAVLDTTGSVTLMTIHASKGLEFPVVVLVDTSAPTTHGSTPLVMQHPVTDELVCKICLPTEEKLVAGFSYAWAQHERKLREEAELKRLLYVAATRARDHLLISGQIGKVSGVLKLITDACDLADKNAVVALPDDETIAFGIRVHKPIYDEHLPEYLSSSEYLLEWLTPIGDDRQMELPNLAPIPVEQDRRIRHISATQLADLGGWYYAGQDADREFYWNNLRRFLFDEMAGKISESLRNAEPRVTQRHVGQVVHEALRYWRFDAPLTEGALRQVLRNYAWQQHITDDDDAQEVVKKAVDLLHRFQNSPIYREIEQVHQAGLPFFSEIPFILQTEKRIIHGVIDVLYQRPDGEWVVLDYKTSRVDGGKEDTTAIQHHAQRYQLQLGAYATAVQQRLGGQIPQTFIHYIRYNKTIAIPTANWQADIQQLEHLLGQFLHA